MNLNKQRGFSLSSVVTIMIVLALLGLFAAKLVPAYLDYFAIKKVLGTMEAAGDLKSMSSRDLRISFSRRASIDNIRSIAAEDLQISRGAAGTSVISAEYSVKTPLVANISLVIDFSVATGQPE